MQNDPAGDYEGEEEGEYHFSDEEISYDVDDGAGGAEPSGAPAVEQPSASAPSSDSGALNSMPKSKRMVLSLGAFLALIFVVYKVISPSGTTQEVDDTFRPPPVAEAPSSAATMQAQGLSDNSVAQPTRQAMQQPANTQASQYTQPVQLSQPQPAASVMPVQQGMPANYPGQQNYSRQDYQQQYGAVQGAASPQQQYDIPGSEKLADQVAQMAAQNQKLMNQLEVQYAQKVQDYQHQNANLQNQVQTLNAKVATMEGRMSEMLDAFKKKQEQKATPNSGEFGYQQQNKNMPHPPATGPKVNYDVQAIIPGRAWLKSNTGDTVTVAVGDTLDGLGKVTKIDPYDGVVQVNTGSQVVSLTYGMGG